MKNYGILLPMLLVAALGGCASQPDGRQPPDPAATQSRAPAPDKPATAEAAKAVPTEAAHSDLSAEMLYKLMSAEIAGQRGDIRFAVAQYVDAARMSRDPEIAERATRIAVYARDDAQALEAVKLWVALAPNSLEAHQVAAAMYVRAGDSSAAERHLERIIELNKQGEHNGFMLVTALLSKERDKQAALAAMEKLTAHRQNNPDALYAYSQLALLVGEYDKALDAADRLRTLRPDWADAHILYSNILIRQGKKAQAIDHLDQAVNRYPKETKLRNYYARVLVDEKRYKEAAAQFKALLDLEPDHTEALYALGLLSMQTSDLDQARKYFLKLNKLGEHLNQSSYYLGQIAESRGKADEAMNWYEQVRGGHYLVDAQIRTAVLQARAGDVKGARQRLQDINVDSDQAQLQIFLAEGEILREAKRFQEALDVYNHGLSEMPNNIQLLYARALTAEKVDRLDLALKDLRYIVGREPENAQALNALGYTLVDRTEQIEEGLKYIKQAYKLKPEDAAILDSLGWAYYRLGNYQKSLEYLRQAFDKLKDAEIAAHLGEVLWVTGDRKGARAVWNEALSQTPSHQLLLDVIKRFTE